MDTVWRIIAIVLIAAVIVTLLKKTSPEMAYLLTLAVCAIVMFLFAESADRIVENIRHVFAASNIPEEIFSPLIKMLAIAIMTKTGADICRDAGEAAFENLVETAGAITAILLSMPLFSTAWELLQELL